MRATKGIHSFKANSGRERVLFQQTLGRTATSANRCELTMCVNLIMNLLGSVYSSTKSDRTDGRTDLDSLSQRTPVKCGISPQTYRSVSG